MNLYQATREQVRQLRAKLISPVWVMLGWTKAVEASVAGGALVEWLTYAVLMTVAWVFLEVLQWVVEESYETADDLAEEAAEEFDD